VSIGKTPIRWFFFRDIGRKPRVLQPRDISPSPASAEREPKIGDLQALARALDTSVAYLMGETDDPQTQKTGPRRAPCACAAISFSARQASPLPSLGAFCPPAERTR
jgi:hypothetical protein